MSPGAGLKALADVFQGSDTIYDHLVQSPVDEIPFSVHVPVARTYGSDNRAM